MPNFCHNCGNEMEPHWRAYPVCGTTTHIQIQQYQQPILSKEPIKPIKEKNWFEERIFGMFAIIIIQVAFPFAWFYTGLAMYLSLPHIFILSIIGILYDEKRTIAYISLILAIILTLYSLVFIVYTLYR